MNDDMEEDLWGPMPTEEEYRLAVANNERRMGRWHQAEVLFGTYTSKQHADTWLTVERPALDDRSVADILNDLDEDAEKAYALINALRAGVNI